MEYTKLNQDQKKELWQWHKEHEVKVKEGGEDGFKSTKKDKKAISAAIDRNFDESMAEKEK